MSVTIAITLTTAAKAVLARLEAFPKAMPGAIAKAMNRQNQLTVAYIQKTYLSFPKQGPTVLNGLRVQSNRLRGSIRASKTTISGDTFTCGIGSNVKYAALHEFGGTFSRTQKAGIVRLRTDREGYLIKQKGNDKLVVFARRRDKHFIEKKHGGSTYTVTYPERMPVRRGINDQAGAYRDAISAAILKLGGAK